MSNALKLNRKQFMSGFWKGMASVATLYSPVSMPAPAQAKITPLRPSIQDPVQALRSDWIAVGLDIDAAVKKYGEIAQK